MVRSIQSCYCFNNRLFRLSVCCLFIALISALLSSKAFADKLIDADLQVSVDGGEPKQIAAYDGDYENNTYVSLRCLADVLSSSSKAFSYTYSFDENTQSGCISINIGHRSSASLPSAQPKYSYSTLHPNYLVINGEERRYWTYSTNNDIYMSLTDLAMAFDMDIEYLDINFIQIHTDRPFVEKISSLESINYFDSLSGIVVGDITSGDILYNNHEDLPVAIASTTKLMTCLLAYDSIYNGRASLDDMVEISAKAEKISQSDDGLISLHAGQKVSLRDLIAAMMLPSSNESCIAIAEYLEGSEEAFVEKMNSRASRLGLTSAHFFNATGLPYFHEDVALSKSHNKMSAIDLYRLAQTLVSQYPEITDICSKKSLYLETLDYTAYNSNPMVYNLPNILGLKTGTTNRAGCCLVSLMKVNAADSPHLILCVLLDAETSAERCTKTEMLLRCVMASFNR